MSTTRRVSFPVCVINYSLFICGSVWKFTPFARRSESVNGGVCCPQESDESLPYLLVLCGDHGMSDSGSHGGSTEPEVNTALVLISSAFKRKGKLHREIFESDEETSKPSWHGGFHSFYRQGWAFFSQPGLSALYPAAPAALTRLFYFDWTDWRHSENMKCEPNPTAEPSFVMKDTWKCVKFSSSLLRFALIVAIFWFMKVLCFVLFSVTKCLEFSSFPCHVRGKKCLLVR